MKIEKMKNLTYKVTSNETTGMKREFSTKKEAVAHARWQKKAGWDATVTDMRSNSVVLDLRASK